VKFAEDVEVPTSDVKKEAAIKGTVDYQLQAEKYPACLLSIATLPADVTMRNYSEAEHPAQRIGQGFRYANDQFVTAAHVMTLVSGSLVLTGKSLGRSIIVPQAEYSVVHDHDLDQSVVTLTKPGIFNTLGVKVAKIGILNPAAQLSLYRRVLKQGVPSFVVSHSPVGFGKASQLVVCHSANSFPGDSGVPMFQGNEVVAMHIGHKTSAKTNVATSLIKFISEAEKSNILLRSTPLADIREAIGGGEDVDMMSNTTSGASNKNFAKRKHAEEALAEARMLGQHQDDQGFFLPRGGREPEKSKHVKGGWADMDDDFVMEGDKLLSNVNCKTRQLVAQQKSPAQQQLIGSTQPPQPLSSSTNTPGPCVEPSIVPAVQTAESKATDSSDSSAISQSVSTQAAFGQQKKKNRKKKKSSVSSSSAVPTSTPLQASS